MGQQHVGVMAGRTHSGEADILQLPGYKVLENWVAAPADNGIHARVYLHQPSAGPCRRNVFRLPWCDSNP